MRVRSLAALLAVPALVVSLGCQKPTPVGKWSGTVNKIPATLEFKEGGTLAISASVMGQTATLSGTWSAEGDTLKMSLTSSNPPMLLNLMPANSRQTTNTWKREGDSMTLTSGGQTQSLTRVKE